MFKANDLVMYGIQGVCCVEEIVSKKVDGVEQEYYVLRPAYSKQSSIFVPVNNEKLTGRMQAVLSEDEIRGLIASMPGIESIWISGDNLRKEKYREILFGGDRYQISAMIKTLYLHRIEQKKKGKKLHISDERCLKEAEKMLYSEFAVVLDMRPEEVSGYIEKEIEKIS